VEGKHGNGSVHEWYDKPDPINHTTCHQQGCAIWAVRRSDGEVFRVGDTVEDRDEMISKIVRFEDLSVGMTIICDNKQAYTMNGLKKSFLTKENRDFLADLGSGKVKLKKEPDLPPAANGKVPVWLTPKEVEKLELLLKTMFTV
jgi:hypothetical protein